MLNGRTSTSCEVWTQSGSRRAPVNEAKDALGTVGLVTLGFTNQNGYTACYNTEEDSNANYLVEMGKLSSPDGKTVFDAFRVGPPKSIATKEHKPLRFPLSGTGIYIKPGKQTEDLNLWRWDGTNFRLVGVVTPPTLLRPQTAG